ncbi:MAG: DUF1559 domain-containing protein [Planctomycetaceae bacterium]
MAELTPDDVVPQSSPSRKTPWGCLIALGIVVAFLAWLIPAVRNAREAARRMGCESHLNQLELAFHNYHDMYGSFPPAYVPDADGKPMHSWRVLILPFIDQVAVYRQYHFNEPWNGPNNSKLSGQIHNDFYQCPSGILEDNSYHTNYVVITGSGTPFPDSSSTTMEDFKDGTENTILIVEIANSDIHWMEPRDLKFDEMSFVVNDPMKPSISSPHPAGSAVVFADSISAYRPGKSLRPETLKALITIAGGENVSKKTLIRKNEWTHRELGE